MIQLQVKNFKSSERVFSHKSTWLESFANNMPLEMLVVERVKN